MTTTQAGDRHASRFSADKTNAPSKRRRTLVRARRLLEIDRISHARSWKEISAKYGNFAPGYLSQVLSGKRDASKALLRAMGLLKVEPHNLRPRMTYAQAVALETLLRENAGDAERRGLLPYMSRLSDAISARAAESSHAEQMAKAMRRGRALGKTQQSAAIRQALEQAAQEMQDAPTEEARQAIAQAIFGKRDTATL